MINRTKMMTVPFSLENKNYRQLLVLYNRKSLSNQISHSMGLSNGGLPEVVVRLAKGECRETIKNALKPYFGSFQQHMT